MHPFMGSGYHHLFTMYFWWFYFDSQHCISDCVLTILLLRALLPAYTDNIYGCRIDVQSLFLQMAIYAPVCISAKFAGFSINLLRVSIYMFLLKVSILAKTFIGSAVSKFMYGLFPSHPSSKPLLSLVLTSCYVCLFPSWFLSMSC